MRIPTYDELKAVFDRYPVDAADVRAALARVPPSWTLIEETEHGAYFLRGKMQVGFTVGKYDDGNLWLHTSATRRAGRSFELPSWDDLKRVKNDFVGADKWAYQVFPDERQYVNDNPYVLHLFARYDRAAALPDFTRGLNTL